MSLRAHDIVVMSAGFEERSTALLKHVVGCGSRKFFVRCAEYSPAVQTNRREEIVALCGQADASLQFVTYDRENPTGAARNFLDNVPSDGLLYVDISGMSRLMIVQLVAEVVRNGSGKRASVLYTEAQDYPPSQIEFEAQMERTGEPASIAMFLSSGVYGLTVVPELSSVAMQGQPTRVIVFPSWNASQMEAICAEIQAPFFSVIHGRPPDPRNAWRLDAIRRINNRIPNHVSIEEHTASTFDYRESLAVLLDIYAAHAQREKLLIVPTGSKMQSVAVGIATGWLSDLQIAYPTPFSFAAAADYTRGVKAIYRMPLSELMPP